MLLINEFIPKVTTHNAKIFKSVFTNDRILLEYTKNGMKSSIILNRKVPKAAISSFYIGIGLYGGEGLKKSYIRKGSARFRKVIEFSNSDSKIIKSFIRFLDVLGVDRQLLSPRIHLRYKGKVRKNINSIKNYWSKITGIPIPKFRKTALYEGTGGGKRKLLYGTLELKIYNGVLWEIINYCMDNIDRL